MLSVTVPKINSSDHFPICLNIKILKSVKKKTHQIIKYRDMKNFNQLNIIQELANQPWSRILECDDTNECHQMFYTYFNDIVNIHAPLKEHRVKYIKLPMSFTGNFTKYRDKGLL